MKLTNLKSEYDSITSLARDFAEELSDQLKQLLNEKNVSLGFPIQIRIKKWKSITEKIKRRSLSIIKITDLSDLVGLRVVLLFKRDVDKVCKMISSSLKVIDQEATQERLKEDQFGYTSVHFVVELPEPWFVVPTIRRMRGLRAEIQIRTHAQHIWADASHILQYKKEASVRPETRRDIHRIAALLEAVDLEFERVLKQRPSPGPVVISRSEQLRRKRDKEGAIRDIMTLYGVDESLAREVWERFIETALTATRDFR